MCAIVGLFKPGGNVDRNTLAAMRDTMTHRGPDDAGLYVNSGETVGLAHRRLSIIDLRRAAVDALEMLAEEVGRDKVRLVHCGYLSDQVRDYLQAHKLDDLVEIRGTLSHSDAVTLTASTDIRLLLLYETAYSSSIVPMKLYNYLILNGPILAVAPESGVTASIIARTRMGCAISPRRGIEAIYRQLLEYYQAWVDGSLTVSPDYAEIQRYDRHAQTGRLAQILTAVAGPRKQDQREVSTHHE